LRESEGGRIKEYNKGRGRGSERERENKNKLGEGVGQCDRLIKNRQVRCLPEGHRGRKYSVGVDGVQG
jgi:hypothetical protein